MNHLLTIAQLTRIELEQLIEAGLAMKAARGKHLERPLANQNWALIFAKSSTRTRVSFEVGVRELGGDVMFLSAGQLQLGRGEPIKDTARVLGRMIQGAVIRTYAQQDVEEFAHYAGIPTINALTDQEHPCQIVADLVTILEKRGSLEGMTVTFVGDGSCNVCRSWIYAAGKLGFELRIASPGNYSPDPECLRAAGAKLVCTEVLQEAMKDADVVYTDVWVSMGQEEESERRIRELSSYQINSKALQAARPDALVMHCLPAYRGKEIDEETLEAHALNIFDQAENRLHAQKAILAHLARSASC